MKSALFTFNLLKAQAVLVLVKVVERRPLPVLVLFGILLPQAVDVLCHLLQHFGLELALGLAGAQLSAAVRASLGARWGIAVESPLLC